MVRSGSRLCARHCADQFAPRHLDAVGTVGPCASTTSCHPRVGLVGFSLGFHLLLLVQPDAYLLGNHVCPVQVLHQPGCVLHCEVGALPGRGGGGHKKDQSMRRWVLLGVRSGLSLQQWFYIVFPRPPEYHIFNGEGGGEGGTRPSPH